jgi:uncharacterized protein
MSLLALLLTLVFGGLVGLISGLLGIGGGVIIVPFLYLLFDAPGWSGIEIAPETRAVVAHATSLFIILPTALSGLVTYQKAQLVFWRAVVPMGIGAAVAAVLGARIAIGLPSELLQLLFGLLLVSIAARMLVGRGRASGLDEAPPQRLHPVLTLGSGAAIGFLSAFLGVGGGIVAIPLLIYLVRLDLRRVAAASIGVIAFAAPAGILTYAVAGWAVTGLPPGTMGYVHVPAGLAMLPGAILCARYGAQLNQRVNVVLLRRMFAVLLVVLGLRLIWVNLGGFPG